MINSSFVSDTPIRSSSWSYTCKLRN